MQYETLLLSIEEHICVLTLNRPDKLNALNFTMNTELPQALREIGEDRKIRAVIITGAGDAFCSGGDVKETLGVQISQPSMWKVNFGRRLKGEPNLIDLVTGMRQAGIPFIAAINGVTVGVGFSLALACDMRIASEKARFSMAFVRRGVCPDTGATYLLPRLIGSGRASELFLTGKFIDASEADRIGLVNRVVPHDELMASAKELAEEIANNPPLAVQVAKRMMYLGMVAPDLGEQIAYESACSRMLMETDDFAEGIKSFTEKRPPEFKGS